MKLSRFLFEAEEEDILGDIDIGDLEALLAQQELEQEKQQPKVSPVAEKPSLPKTTRTFNIKIKKAEIPVDEPTLTQKSTAISSEPELSAKEIEKQLSDIGSIDIEEFRRQLKATKTKTKKVSVPKSERIKLIQTLPRKRTAYRKQIDKLRSARAKLSPDQWPKNNPDQMKKYMSDLLNSFFNLSNTSQIEAKKQEIKDSFEKSNAPKFRKSAFEKFKSGIDYIVNNYVQNIGPTDLEFYKTRVAIPYTSNPKADIKNLLMSIVKKDTNMDKYEKEIYPQIIVPTRAVPPTAKPMSLVSALPGGNRISARAGK